MALRFLTRSAAHHKRRCVAAVASARCYSSREDGSAACSSSSSSPDGVDKVAVRESPIDGVFVLEMQHSTTVGSPCLSTSLLSSLLDTIRTVCDPDKGHARGLILTSRTPGIFGGDVDINSILTSDQALFAYYWHQFQQLFVTLHALPVPTAAAFGGLCSTGGTAIALACDYRVMASTSGTASLVDSAIGIAAARDGFCAPPYLAGSLERVVGFRRAEQMLTLGMMLAADEAASCGLVDEVVDTPDEAVVPCLEQIEKVLELPSPLPYWLAKDTLRRQVLAPLCTHALRTADTASMYEMLRNPRVRATLEKMRPA